MGDFKKGNRVILTQAITSPSPTIPLQGSEYECVGTVMSSGTVHAWVRWDNGRESFFFVYKLKLYKDDISEDDPNSAFLRKKRKNISKFGGHDIDRYAVDEVCDGL